MSAVRTATRPAWNPLRAFGLMLVILGIGAVLPSDGYADEGSGTVERNAALFETTGESLLRALISADTEERKVHLRAAQASVDQVVVHADTPVGGGDNSAFSQFGRDVEVSISQAEAAIKQRLYLTLMRLVWESPYSIAPEDELGALETVADALETLHTLTQQDPGNRSGLEQIQSAYWSWLKARRDEIGLALSAINENTDQPVFDQRVVAAESGRAEIYQLTGTDDRRLEWQVVDGIKIGSTINVAGPLSLDLSTVHAPWVVIISGSNLGQYVNPHLSWLEELREQSLIILIEREDFAGLLQGLPIDVFARRLNPLYVFPGEQAAASGNLILVNTSDQEALAQWPTSYLGHERAEILKSMITKVTSVPTSR
jgi:hypothetical protein